MSATQVGDLPTLQHLLVAYQAQRLISLVEKPFLSDIARMFAED